MQNPLDKYKKFVKVVEENIDDPRLKEKILKELKDAKEANKDIEHLKSIMKSAIHYINTSMNTAKAYIAKKIKKKKEAK